MVWFCHDVIYGKAKHVVELGADWNIFSWVVNRIYFNLDHTQHSLQPEISMSFIVGAETERTLLSASLGPTEALRNRVL